MNRFALVACTCLALLLTTAHGQEPKQTAVPAVPALPPVPAAPALPSVPGPSPGQGYPYDPYQSPYGPGQFRNPFGPYPFPYGQSPYSEGYGANPYSPSSPYGQGNQYLPKQGPEAKPDNRATVRVRLPSTAADVWVEGHKMPDRLSSERVFHSPPLESGHAYQYTVKARWAQRGEMVTAERQVRVSANQTAVVDFTKTRGK